MTFNERSLRTVRVSTMTFSASLGCVLAPCVAITHIHGDSRADVTHARARAAGAGAADDVDRR